MFLPRMAPTIVSGRITNRQIQATEIWANIHIHIYTITETALQKIKKSALSNMFMGKKV